MLQMCNPTYNVYDSIHMNEVLSHLHFEDKRRIAALHVQMLLFVCCFFCLEVKLENYLLTTY